ncbi:MAG: spore germination protein [Lachnospiraceae bacterium]|nr:spore germination protein [Lachnospiraceae bacterium]
MVLFAPFFDKFRRFFPVGGQNGFRHVGIGLYAIKFMRVILLILISLLNIWGFVLGTLLIICAVVFNKTIAGKSYIYPLIPFSWAECRKRFFRCRLPHRSKNS